MSDQPRSYRAQYHKSSASDGSWELRHVSETDPYPEDTSQVRATSVQLGYGMIIARCTAYSFIEAATEFDGFRL